MDLHEYQTVGLITGIVNLLLLLGGIVLAGVTIRRNGRASVLVMVGCVMMLLGIVFSFFAFRLIGFGIAHVVTSLLHMTGLVLVILGGALPRKDPAKPQLPYGGWTAPQAPGQPQYPGQPAPQGPMMAPHAPEAPYGQQVPGQGSYGQEMPGQPMPGQYGQQPMPGSYGQQQPQVPGQFGQQPQQPYVQQQNPYPPMG
ncbi:hypothetical protein [Longispora albida]|uniref:hypothetical protein n=1 Tax=Longispora albida TaxID=203523 RepID=UPI0003733327|nr:hypothetical protein [Longispora albida]